MPGPRAGQVPRPRLTARLDEGLARGLAEVRVTEPRFTSAEAGELLQPVASALPDASVAALAARTEAVARARELSLIP
jgi:hypothetical protein